MIKNLMVKVLAATACLLPASSLFALTGVGHQKMIIECIYGSEYLKDDAARQLVDYISKGMDYGGGAKPVEFWQQGSSFLNTARKEFPNFTGTHREFGHWPLDGDIPKQVLQEFEKVYPGRKNEFTELWRRFVSSRREATRVGVGLTKEAGRVAQSLTSLNGSCHLLGDWTTADTRGLPSLKTVVRDIERSYHRILGNNSEVVAEFVSELKSVPDTLPVAERAKRMADIWRDNTKLHDATKNVLKRYGHSGRFKPIDFNELARYEKGLAKGVAGETAKVAKDIIERADCIRRNLVADYRGSTSKPLGGKVSVQPGEDVATASRRIAEDNAKKLKALEPELLRAHPEVKNCKTVVGLAKRVPVKKGAGTAMRTALVLPASAATAAGTAAVELAGALVISEGITFLSYVNDGITEYEFYDETARNLTASAASAAAVYVAVAIGASPGGPVVMAVAVGAYLVADITYRVVKYLLRLETFSLDDVLGALPGEFDDAHGILKPEMEKTILDRCDEPNILAPEQGEGVLNPRKNERTILDGF